MTVLGHIGYGVEKKLITAIVMSGHGLELMKLVEEQPGVLSVTHHHARGMLRGRHCVRPRPFRGRHRDRIDREPGTGARQGYRRERAEATPSPPGVHGRYRRAARYRPGGRQARRRLPVHDRRPRQGHPRRSGQPRGGGRRARSSASFPRNPKPESRSARRETPALAPPIKPKPNPSKQIIRVILFILVCISMCDENI